MVKKVLKSDVVDSTSTTATEVAPKKVRAKSAVAKEASAKKAKAAPKEAVPKKLSVRTRALQAIRDSKNGLTAAEAKEAIGLGHGLKPTLDQEVERGNLTHAPSKDDKEVATYKITAAGSAALKSGTLDIRGKAK